MSTVFGYQPRSIGSGMVPDSRHLALTNDFSPEPLSSSLYEYDPFFRSPGSSDTTRKDNNHFLPSDDFFRTMSGELSNDT